MTCELFDPWAHHRGSRVRELRRSPSGLARSTWIAWLVGALLGLLLCPSADAGTGTGTARTWPTCRDASGPFGLGEIQFPNSGAPSAQRDFMRGVLLLYSFEYGDARNAFQAAEHDDPGFAMAYWGDALTYDETIWQEEDVAGARAALGRLAPTAAQRAAKAKTPRERAYLAAVEQLYGPGDKTQRDANYSAAMHALVQAYPHDLNARTFYALSLLGLTDGVRNPSNYMRAAAEAETVLQIDPCHPGALHYLIHAVDDPVDAVLGLQAARRLAEVAPASEHAVHMASHIYMALGMWKGVIKTNLASIRVARAAHMTAYHQIIFLIYAYLQEGERQPAEHWIQLISRETHAVPGQQAGAQGKRAVTLSNLKSGAVLDARARLAYARAMWLIETRGARGTDDTIPVDRQGIAAIDYFAVQDFALGITAGTDKVRAHAALARLDSLIAAARVTPQGVATGWLETVTGGQLRRARLLADALKGFVTYQDGDRRAGLVELSAAAAAASQLPYEYGPPWSAKPLEELLGEVLLTDGQRAAAIDAFRKTLAQYPNRRLTREDLAAAQQQH